MRLLDKPENRKLIKELYEKYFLAEELNLNDLYIDLIKILNKNKSSFTMVQDFMDLHKDDLIFFLLIESVMNSRIRIDYLPKGEEDSFKPLAENYLSRFYYFLKKEIDGN